MSREWPYVQSTGDHISTKKARDRFTSLETDLAAIGAKINMPVLMVHDEARFDVEVPDGMEMQVAAIMDKYFPPDPVQRDRVAELRERINQLMVEVGPVSLTVETRCGRTWGQLAEDKNREPSK